MWIVIALAVTASAAIVPLGITRKARARDRRLVRERIEWLAALAANPDVGGETTFTGPHRFEEDPSHDTMFTARNGDARFSFILDVSRRRVRWWILCEREEERLEATLVEGAIPAAAMQTLLKAARGEPPARPTPEPPPTPEPHIDPFEPVPSDPPTTAQA